MDRFALLRRLVALAALVLLGVTWRLWTPQSLYPRIPLARWAGATPAWLEWGIIGLTTLALAACLLASEASRVWRPTLLTFAASLGGLVLIDQHRLQPWAWEFLLLAAVLAPAPPGRAWPLMRVLVISVYVHSGLSKLDATFLDSHGQELVFGTLKGWGVDLWHWPPWARQAAAALLPVGELLIAVGLAVPKLRRFGLAVSVFMHAALLAAFGPWGRGYEAAVLIWNVYFIAQNVLLFGGRDVPEALPDGPATSGRFGSAATTVTVAAVLLPLLEPWGWFDVWPSWAVFASRPARVTVSLDDEGIERLPQELRRYLQPPRFGDLRPRVDIARWSFDTLAVPIYPQDRFHFGVALAVAERHDLGDAIHVTHESIADRWTGERTVREIKGTRDIAAAAEGFLLNARPRGAGL